MPVVRTAERVVVSVTATESGDWQVVSTPTGFQGITATRFAEGDYLEAVLLHEDGEQWEVYAGNSTDNLLEITSITGTVTLARPSDANIAESSNSDNRITAGAGTHTLIVGPTGTAAARFFRETNPTWKTFTSADATPSVADYRHFKTNGTTAITQFDDMATGQLFRIYRNGSDITLTYAADKIILPGLVDLTLTTDEPVATFVEDNGVARWVGGGLSKASLLTVPNVYASTELTISSGAITPTRASHSVDTESDAATDDLATVTATNLQAGDVVLLTRNNSARTPIVKHGTGNVQLRKGRDLYLGMATQALALRYDGSNLVDMLAGGSDRMFNILDYGAISGGGDTDKTTNTTAIQRAIDAAVAAGGGVVYIPSGTYYVTNPNAPSGVTWNLDRVFSIEDDNIFILGEDRFSTTIVNANGSDAHMFAWGNRSSTPAVTVSGGGIANITLDGNRANQSAPTVDDDHWINILIESGCTDIVVDNFTSLNAQYYHVGLQSDDIMRCTISNGLLDGSNADGLDVKSDTNGTSGILIENIHVKNFGLSAVLSDQTGINVRAGCRVYNCTVEFGAGSSDNYGYFYQRASDLLYFDITEPTIFSNCIAIGTTKTSTYGFRFAGYRVQASNCFAYNCATGFWNTSEESSLSQCDAFECANGFLLGQSGSFGADASSYLGCNARACDDQGFDLDDVGEVTFIGCNSRGNDKGVTLDADCISIRWIGGSIASNSTSQYTNSAAFSAKNITADVSGLTGSIAFVEEGSFTPALGNANGNPVASYTLQTGRYCQIGSVMTITGRIECTIISAGPSFDALTGDWYVEGLPETAIASIGGVGIVGNLTNIDLPSGAIQVAGVVNPSTAQIRLRVDADNGTPTTLNRFHMVAGAAIAFSFHISYAVGA